MTIQQDKQDTAEYRLKKAQEENKLLLVQLHQLEEELEKGKSSKAGDGVAGLVWVDDELPNALAEVERLQAQVTVLRKTHQLESDNSLNVKLGNILIQGTDSPVNLMAVPRKVGKIWLESSRKTPPKALGGKEFEKVIEAFHDGGKEAVEKLFSRVSPAPSMQANGYTALARHVMKSDRTTAAEAARRAYETDPKPFRLKWLAFKLHEAGDVIEAEAMLDILPTDITFSESESRQANQLRNEAKRVRQHEAKHKTGFSERRAEVERQVSELQAKITQEKDENEFLLLQLHQTQEELEQQFLKCQTLEQAQAKLEKEKLALTFKKDEQVKLLADSQTRIIQLTQVKVQNEEENESLLLQLHQVQEELESQLLKCQALEQKKLALADQNDEQVKLEEELQEQIEKLVQEKTTFEKEHDQEIASLKRTMARNKEESELFQKQLSDELESLYVKNKTLDQERSELADQKDKLSKLTTGRETRIEQLIQEKATVESEFGSEIEVLKQTQAELEAERQAQIEQLTQAKAAVEAKRVKEVETLRQTQATSEQEKAALADQKDEQAKLAAERLKKINELQQEAKAQQASKDEHSLRQQMMQEEMIRAEAQIDLIKDVLLRESGL